MGINNGLLLKPESQLHSRMSAGKLFRMIDTAYENHHHHLFHQSTPTIRKQKRTTIQQCGLNCKRRIGPLTCSNNTYKNYAKFKTYTMVTTIITQRNT